MKPRHCRVLAGGMALAMAEAPQPDPEDGDMTIDKKNWNLQADVAMSPEVANEVAKIACALKSLSAYTTFAMEREDCPEELQKLVDEGLEAMAKIFVW
jgi:hypothetical protein